MKKKRDIKGWQPSDVPVLRDDDGLSCGYDDYKVSVANMQEEIDKKFTKKKTQTETLGAAYHINDLLDRAYRVLDCGSFLEFRVSKDSAKLQHANFCRDRLCPMCNWRRSMKIFHQVSQVMDVIQNDYEFLSLTLTVKNCDAKDLPKTVQVLFDGWRYLYHKNREFRTVVCGTFRSLEVTRNPVTGQYHPHLHCILAVKKSYFKKGYLTQKRFTELWKKACDLNYNPIVHVQKVYGRDSSGNKVQKGFDVKAAVCEATKYAVKGSDYLVPEDMDLTASVVRSLLDALSGRRLCGWTGIFAKTRKDLNLDDCENGDLVHTDDSIRDDVEGLIVRYRWKCGVYVMLGEGKM